MTEQGSAPPRRWPLVLVALSFVVMLGIWGVDRLLLPLFQPLIGQKVTSARDAVPVEIAGETLRVPANYIRFSDQRRGGRQPRLDLFAVLPDLSGFSTEREADFSDTGATSPLVFIAITPREEGPSAAIRLAAVYQRHFTGAPLAGPDGLIGRTMAAGSGYDGETVYFEGGSTSPFVARCFPAEATTAPATCLRELDLGAGLSVLYRFRAAHLGLWRGLDARVKALGASLLARPPA